MKNLKKLLTATICVAMIATLAACGNDDVNAGVDPNLQADTPAAQGEGPGNVDMPAIGTEPETVPDPNATPDDDMSVTPEVNLANVQAEAIAASINPEALSVFPILTDWEGDLQFMSQMMGFSEEMFSEDFAICASSMNVTAFAVVVAVPAEGQSDALVAALEGYKEQQIQSFTNYLPEPLEHATNAIIETLSDGTVVLAMTEDAQATVDSIKATLGV